jgi:hypothetical protein
MNALMIPVVRSVWSGVFAIVATARRAASGNAANSSPSITRTSPQRGQEVDHRPAPGSPAYFSAACGEAWGTLWGADADAPFPTGSPKYLKKSESGRSTRRVSLARKPVS